VAVFTGSARSLRNNSFDVAVANLNAPAIATLAKDLDRVARCIVVSGFHEDEQGRVEKQFSKPVVERLEFEGWACLIF
jgi:ribosomal protein L11 methylase PrmA